MSVINDHNPQPNERKNSTKARELKVQNEGRKERHGTHFPMEDKDSSNEKRVSDMGDL